MIVNKTIAVLLVEDNPGDALLVQEYLSEEEQLRFEVEHCTRLDQALTQAGQAVWDVILLDLTLPDARHLEAVERMLMVAGATPIVVMSGLGDQDIALKAVKRGAQDYLVKGQVEPRGLSKALTYAIERAKTQRQLQEARTHAEVLKETTSRLQQITEAQKRFVSDAAHELRAPLTAIAGNLELLQRFPEMPEAERMEALAEASQQTKRMTRLIADMLTLARGEGGVPLRLDRILLSEVLLKAFNESHHLASGHSMHLEGLEDLWVYGDSDYLRQLVIILLDNAIKYTPAPGRISLKLSADGPDALLQVSDEGVGIAAEEAEKVFERFYRTDKARSPSPDPGGSGLGLSIAKWIAESHGGSIWLKSQPQQGTTVFVRLPQNP